MRALKIGSAIALLATATHAGDWPEIGDKFRQDDGTTLVVAKLKANGFKIITTESVAANVKVTDDIAAASPTTNLAFALGPEDVKVEFVEVKSQKIPIQLNHVHFFGQMNTEMQAWYAKTFGATMLPANPNTASSLSSSSPFQ